MSITNDKDFPPLQPAKGKAGSALALHNYFANQEDDAMDTSKPKKVNANPPQQGTRRPLIPTPTKQPLAKKPTPDGNTANEASFADLVAAIRKLETKIDAVGQKVDAMEKHMIENTEQLKKNAAQLEKNSGMISDCMKSLNEHTGQIAEIKSKVEKLEEENAEVKKENKLLREKVLEVERYKRRWNLRLSGLKEEDDENIRGKIEELLLQLFPQWATNIGNIIDSVHRVGPKERGRSRQVIMQFVRRLHRDAVWKSTKDSSICKERGVRFVQDFTKEDRLARELLWPKIKLARSQGKAAFYRGHVAVIDGRAVTI